MIKVYKAGRDCSEEPDILQTLSTTSDAFWIDLISPSTEEDKQVESALGLSIPTREDMQEIELSARLYTENGLEYMTIIAVSKIHLGDPQKFAVTFILTPRGLITVRYADFLSFDHFIQTFTKKNTMSFHNGEQILFGLIESTIDRVADSLEDLGNEVDILSSEIFRTKKVSVKRKTGQLQSAIRRIGEKGDLLSMLRESLASILRLLSHHAAQIPDDDKSKKSSRQMVMLLNRDVLSLNDHALFLAGKISFLLDATLGMINLEQNQIIKIFSIVAVVFLPPTLVASIYGMNFNFMPELSWPYGYPMALGFMILSALIPLAYFKRKGWL
jgi:magnesium transporter